VATVGPKMQSWLLRGPPHAARKSRD